MACTASALGLGASSLFHLSRTIGVAPFAQTGTAVVRSRGWEIYSLLLCLCNVVAVNYMSVTVYNTLTGSFYTDMIGMSYITKGTCAWCLHLVSLARRVHVARAFNSILRYEALGCWPADEPRRGRPRARRRLWGRLWGRLRGRLRGGCGAAVVVWVQLLAIASVCLWTFALSWSYHVKQTLLEKVVALFAYYLPPMYIFAMDLQFGNMALIVYRQLRGLSRSTQHLQQAAQAAQAAQEQGQGPLHLPHLPHLPGLRQVTRQLRARQESIYTSIAKLNRAYSLQLLLSVTLCLQEATTGLYFAITSQYSQWKPLIAAWATVSVSKLALLMTPCQWVESEGQVITDAVNSALQVRDVAAADREELEEFQVQLVHLKMRFSAAGIFPLDYSQLQKVISTITTYLVILLQMQGRSGTTPSA